MAELVKCWVCRNNFAVSDKAYQRFQNLKEFFQTEYSRNAKAKPICKNCRKMMESQEEERKMMESQEEES